jgi:hypothetical protein
MHVNFPVYMYHTSIINFILSFVSAAECGVFTPNTDERFMLQSR